MVKGATMVDIDRLEAKYSGKRPPTARCPSCDAPLELASREEDGDEVWHCSNVPSHRHFCRNSGIDKDVIAAVRELRDRRKDGIGYQKMIRQAIDLLEAAEIDEAMELLEACDDTDG